MGDGLSYSYQHGAFIGGHHFQGVATILQVHQPVRSLHLETPLEGLIRRFIGRYADVDTPTFEAQDDGAINRTEPPAAQLRHLERGVGVDEDRAEVEEAHEDPRAGACADGVTFIKDGDFRHLDPFGVASPLNEADALDQSAEPLINDNGIADVPPDGVPATEDNPQE